MHKQDVSMSPLLLTCSYCEQRDPIIEHRNHICANNSTEHLKPMPMQLTLNNFIQQYGSKVLYTGTSTLQKGPYSATAPEHKLHVGQAAKEPSKKSLTVRLQKAKQLSRHAALHHHDDAEPRLDKSSCHDRKNPKA